MGRKGSVRLWGIFFLVFAYFIWSLYYYCNQERYTVKRKERKRVWGQWSRTQSVVGVRGLESALLACGVPPPPLPAPLSCETRELTPRSLFTKEPGRLSRIGI